MRHKTRGREVVFINDLKKVQNYLLTQMKRLDSCTAKSEIILETNRSGALSQNATAYLKSCALLLRVQETSKNNSKVFNDTLKTIGVINENQEK